MVKDLSLRNVFYGQVAELVVPTQFSIFVKKITMKSFYRLEKKVGNAVLAKYDNKCINCGSTKNLCVHHVIKMKPNDENYNDIENLTVLCRSCHLSHHRKEGDVAPNNLPPAGNPYGRRGKKPPIKCIEDGCENWQHGKLLCKKHYEYKRRKGLL